MSANASFLSPVKTPEEMLQALRACFVEASKLAASIEGTYALLEGEVSKADCIGTVRDCCKASEAITKQLTPVFKRLSDYLCRDLIAKVQEGDESGLKVEGKSYTVKPDLEMGFQVPTLKNDPIGFRQMHELLGTPLHYIDSGEVLTERGREPTEVLKISFKGLQARLKRRVADGGELPPPFNNGKTWVNYNLIIRAKNREGREADE